jgi:hypothetical protein
MPSRTLTPIPLNADTFAAFGAVFDLGKDAPSTRDAFAAPMKNYRDKARLNGSKFIPIRRKPLSPSPCPATLFWSVRPSSMEHRTSSPP